MSNGTKAYSCYKIIDRRGNPMQHTCVIHRDRFEVLHRNMILQSRLYVILGNDTVAGKCDGHNFTGCYGSERARAPAGPGPAGLNSYWTVTVFSRDGWNLEHVFSNETELTRRISRIWMVFEG